MKDEFIITVDNLWFKYTSGKDYALKGISLRVKRGEFIVIMGPSGCGKSTLAYTLNGIIPNMFRGKYKGKVIVDGLSTLEHSIAELSTRVGLVFQDPEAQLVMTNVLEEITFGPENLGLPRNEILKRLEEAIKISRLGDKLYRSPRELSGGEKQALAIASVLALRPKVLVLDEVTSMIDPLGKRLVSEIVVRLNKEYGLTVIAIDHRVEWAAEYADRIVIMNDGRIIGKGSPKEIFSTPKLVRDIGFRAPQVSELAYSLINEGVKINEIPVSLREAINIYSKILEAFKDERNTN